MTANSPKAGDKSAPNAVRAGGLMMLALMLSRVLGLVRDAIIAGQFGSGPDTDAYRLAFSVPDLLFFLIAGGALSSAFIPVFSEYLHTDREDEAWHVFSVVATVMSLIVFGFIAFALCFSEPLAHLVAPGKPDSMIPVIAYMSRIVLPAQFAFFIGGLMFGTLYARQVFAVPGLGPNVYNIGIIFGAVFISHFVTPGVIGMSWGALGGAIIGNLVIPFFAMRKLRAKFKFSVDVKHPGVRKVFRLMLPVVLGLSLPGVYALIMQAYGSYYPNGVNTVLEFSNKLMQAPLGIFGQSLAIGVFPALTQFYAQQRMDLYRTQLESTLRTVIYLTVPISVLMAVLALPISAAMYRHGKFTLEATHQVAHCLQWFCLGITAWCLHPVLMRGFFAIQDSKTPVIIGTATTAVFVGLIYALRNSPLSYQSLPLASSISSLVLVVILTAVVGKKIGGLDVASLVKTLGLSLVASIPVAVIAGIIGFTSLAERVVGSKIVQLGTVGLVFACAGVAYLAASKALGIKESSYVTNVIAKMRRKLGAPTNA